MPTHAEKRFLPYTPEKLYNLVSDVEKYPEFLPWCIALRICRREVTTINADMVIGFKVFRLLGFWVSKFLGFKVPKIHQIAISCFLEDMDLLSNIPKNILDGSTVFFGACLFHKFRYLDLQRFDS